MIYLDTHVIIWLYMGDLTRFSSFGRDLLEKEELYISPMVQLELNFLHEIKKILLSPAKILDYLHYEIDLKMYDGTLEKVVHFSLPLQWTRDLFDRLIVANAIADHSQLLTKDETILKNYTLAVW